MIKTILQLDIPDGYTADGYRYPKKGERYLLHDGNVSEPTTMDFTCQKFVVLKPVQASPPPEPVTIDHVIRALEGDPISVRWHYFKRHPKQYLFKALRISLEPTGYLYRVELETVTTEIVDTFTDVYAAIKAYNEIV